MRLPLIEHFQEQGFTSYSGNDAVSSTATIDHKQEVSCGHFLVGIGTHVLILRTAALKSATHLAGS